MRSKNTTLQNFEKLLNTSNYEEVRIFIKSTSYLRNTKIAYAFWSSKLPVKWFKKLASEPFFETLLSNYFKSLIKPNSEFLKLFFGSNKLPILKRVIKQNKAFNLQNHWESFTIFKHDSQLKVFYKELEYIKEYQKYWQSKSAKFNDIIESFALEDILFQMTMCYEDFKQNSNQFQGNWNNRISTEAILIDLINAFISVKLKSLKKSTTKVTNTYSSDYFSKITVEEYQEKKYKFREIVSFYFEKHDNEYQLNKYLSNYAEFDFIDGLEAELFTNDKYLEYRKTLSRGTYDETYLINKVIADKDKLSQIKGETEFWNKQLQLNILASLEYFKFLRVPLTIEKDNQVICLKKVLRLLITFSKFLMPQGDMETNGNRFELNLPKSFKKLYYADYFVCFGEKELIRSCCEYFEWNKEEAKEIIKFLTTDLNNTALNIVDVKMNPFIKKGNQYFWLSSFMKDRRWEISLHRKLVNDALLDAKTQSDNSEVYLSKIFENAGFSSVSGQRYTHEGKRGEIDVLAYKDNVLFVCELKSTYIVEDMLKTSRYERDKFVKAAEQLDRAKTYIEENFEVIKVIKELKINCDINDLTIETMIVSNSYQADHVFINNKHLKVSLFELLIILKNDLYDMLHSKMLEVVFNDSFQFPIDDVLKIYNQKNPDSIDTNNKYTKEQCNLWENDSYCTGKDIISAIKENKVWCNQDKNWHYRKEVLELRVF